MVRRFIRGYLDNGSIVEDKNGNLYGLCVNEHISLLEKSDTIVKYNVNHKETLKEDSITIDNEFKEHLKEIFDKHTPK